MSKIVCGKDVADSLIKNNYFAAELVDRFLKNEFGNSRGQI